MQEHNNDTDTVFLGENHDQVPSRESDSVTFPIDHSHNDDSTLAYGAMRESIKESADIGGSDKYSFDFSQNSGVSTDSALSPKNSKDTYSDAEKTAIVSNADIFANAGIQGSHLEHSSGTVVAGKNRHTALWISLTVLACVVISLAVAFFAANWFFSNHVAPGVYFGNHNLVAKNESEVRQIVEKDAQNAQLMLTDDQGKKVQVTLNDLGTNINVDKTVHNILQAKQSSWLERLNPLKTVHVDFVASQDNDALKKYVVEHFLNKEDRAVPTTIRFDEKSEKFIVVAGKSGKTPIYKSIVQSVNRLLRDRQSSLDVQFSYKTVEAPISENTAQTAANEANAHLASSIVINNGSDRTYKLDTTQIASWIHTNENLQKGTLAVSFDGKSAQSYVEQQLPQYLNQKMVTQQDYVDTKGRLILISTKGQDGVQLTNVPQLAGKITSALQNSQNLNMTAPANITKFDVKHTVVTTRLVVNKSDQTVSVYRDDKIIKKFLVCTGRDIDETENGVYTIYLRYRSQDMRGPNGDGTNYFSPGVKWVSYFHGGEAFHTAIWNYDGIKHGNPTKRGSHGCVNMYEQDAHWIFDNCPKGTIVQVIGNQPTGPVR